MTEKTSGSIPATEFNTRYQYVRKYKDFLLGECSLLRDKTLKQTVLAKEKILKSEKELQLQTKYSELLMNLNQCPTFTQFYGFTQKPAPQLGDNTHTVIEIREFIDHDFEREILARLRDRDVLTEEDVWKATQQLISAFAKLQQYNIAHGHICPKAISLIKADGVQAKIHWSNIHESTYSQVISGSLPLSAKCYLAPEVLATMQKKKKKDQNPPINPVLSDVFSLGVTILSICTLGDIDDIYNLEEMVVSLQQLKTKLNWVKTIYSERLHFLLNKMLKLDPSRRSDFRCLEDLANFVSKSGEVPEEPGTAGTTSSQKLRQSSSPDSKMGTGSFGRKTLTSGFEVQKLRLSLSPRSGRNTMSGYKTRESGLSTSPRRPTSKTSPRLLNQRIESTIASVFDRKASPLKKEGKIISSF